MPIFEYKCPRCGKVFEEWVRSADAAPEKQCPSCAASSPRIISRTSFVLKGDGWYVSDYGYRKGISEDDSSSSRTPAEAKPVTPAKQGGKAIAKKEPAAPPATKAPEKAAPAKAPATKTASKTAASND